jgi:hypothetical protein
MGVESRIAKMVFEYCAHHVVGHSCPQLPATGPAGRSSARSCDPEPSAPVASTSSSTPTASTSSSTPTASTSSSTPTASTSSSASTASAAPAETKDKNPAAECAWDLRFCTGRTVDDLLSIVQVSFRRVRHGTHYHSRTGCKFPQRSAAAQTLVHAYRRTHPRQDSGRDPKDIWCAASADVLLTHARTHAGIVNPLTPEEEAELESSNLWCKKHDG